MKYNTTPTFPRSLYVIAWFVLLTSLYNSFSTPTEPVLASIRSGDDVALSARGEIVPAKSELSMHARVVKLELSLPALEVATEWKTPRKVEKPAPRESRQKPQSKISSITRPSGRTVMVFQAIGNDIRQVRLEAKTTFSRTPSNSSYIGTRNVVAALAKRGNFSEVEKDATPPPPPRRKAPAHFIPERPLELEQIKKKEIKPKKKYLRGPQNCALVSCGSPWETVMLGVFGVVLLLATLLLTERRQLRSLYYQHFGANRRRRR